MVTFSPASIAAPIGHDVMDFPFSDLNVAPTWGLFLLVSSLLLTFYVLRFTSYALRFTLIRFTF